MKTPTPPKRIQINNEKSKLAGYVAAATAITIFCLISSKSLISQANHQRHVINARNQAVKQLRQDLDSAKQLVSSYNSIFENKDPSNILGGKNTTDPNTGPPDGDNARIALDALPSSYDFPALISSMTKILANNGITTPTVVAIDDSLSQKNDATGKPQPVVISLTVGGTADIGKIQKLITDLERSVRPFDVTSVQLNGNAGKMAFTLGVNTYYQQQKTINISTKEVH